MEDVVHKNGKVANKSSHTKTTRKTGKSKSGVNDEDKDAYLLTDLWKGNISKNDKDLFPTMFKVDDSNTTTTTYKKRTNAPSPSLLSCPPSPKKRGKASSPSFKYSYSSSSDSSTPGDARKPNPRKQVPKTEKSTKNASIDDMYRKPSAKELASLKTAKTSTSKVTAVSRRTNGLKKDPPNASSPSTSTTVARGGGRSDRRAGDDLTSERRQCPKRVALPPWKETKGR